ncbi:MAG: alternative ribosome rescue aminoacyl-tRNA hydrolase ArfB [Sediminibacterium sp.]|nr:alternative ribosome rescue aminoacyl-tRNA hydrolase ArfB [Sediminibacterium sp.]
MLLSKEQIETLESEIVFKTSRSSGSGGQNVNKVETRVEVLFSIERSLVLTPAQKTLLLSKLEALQVERLVAKTKRMVLSVASEKYRTQLKNKSEAFDKLVQLFQKALKPKVKRISTKPTIASKKVRKEGKKRLSDKKINRRKVDL